MKPRCKHAGDLHPASGTRPCALGEFGGSVRKTDECQRCAKWEPAAPPAAAAKAPARVPLPVLAPCVHEGAVLEYCPTCRGEGRHVRDCDLHERCTRDAVSPVVRACASCPDHSARARPEIQ
jgi:hypothetical protein